MRLLLDTHTFVYSFAEPHRLSRRVQNLLGDPGNERWVSAVSFWEISTKIQIGKLKLPADRAYYSERLKDLQARPLPLELRHSLALFDLPRHHKDPFDRLLIAQAREEGLTLATRDEVFARYPVETIW